MSSASRNGSAEGAEALAGPSPILKHRSENRVVRELKNVALKGCDEQLRVRSGFRIWSSFACFLLVRVDTLLTARTYSLSSWCKCVM